MISAGNDIVALNAVDAQRTQLPVFYSKFITPPEFALFNPDEITLVNFVWLLWSAKESAYKYLRRLDPELTFAPAKLVVQILNVFNSPKKDANVLCHYRGLIADGDTALPFLSAITREYIATVIDRGNVKWAVKQIDTTDYESQSKAVRNLLLADLQMADISIYKHLSGYPILIKDGKELDIAVSFAHHDRYISYSYQIPK